MASTAAITDRLHDLSLSVPIHVEITADYDSATQIGETPHTIAKSKRPPCQAVARQHECGRRAIGC